MNDHTHNLPEDGIAPELLGVASSLDRLGSLDREAAGALFEARLAAATRPGGSLDERHLSALAGAERGAAAGSLEDRIFVATRGLLPRTPAEAAPTTMRIRVGFATRALRVAASLAVVLGAGALSYNSLGPAKSGTSVASRTSTKAIASQLEADFADLASILSVALGSSESDTASSSTTLETAYESGEIDFPQFDLLGSTGTEGSL